MGVTNTTDSDGKTPLTIVAMNIAGSQIPLVFSPLRAMIVAVLTVKLALGLWCGRS